MLLVLASRTDERDRRTPAPAPDRIAGCRRGDRAALDEVFREHAPALERFLARLVGPRAELEDLLQETFAAAITAFPRFRGAASVKTWLHSIAVHVANDHLRRPRRATTSADEHALASMETGPDEALAQREIAARVYAHLDRLDANKRIALVLFVIEGLSIAEIAAMTGASVMATKSRLFWARRDMLKRLRRDPALSRRGEP